jgi:hypothetical protein
VAQQTLIILAVNVGNVGNLRIGGGTANYVLTAVDTSGNVAWRGPCYKQYSQW